MKESKVSTVRRRYARLPLALALGAMVLTPALIGVGASEAEASVAGKGETSITLSGDARLRGFWREDAYFGNVDDDENAQLQHRMRVAMDVKAAGGTSLHTRFHLANNSHYQWGGPGKATGNDKENLNMATDYFYVNVPVGPVNVLAGRQVVNWGHRMKAWDARADRLRANYKVNDELTVFGYYQKDLEASPAGTGVNWDTLANVGKDDDRNRYSLGMVYNTADFRLGAQIRHTDEEWDTGDSGQELYGFATYKMDDLTANLEFDFQFGDVFENEEGDKPWAVFLGLEYALGDTKLTLGGAYAAKGWSSGSGGHFDQITLAYNTSGGHNIGYARLGQNSEEKEWAIGVGAFHKLSPELTIGGRLAYLDGSDYDNFGWDAVAFDLGLAYKINASTTYHVDGLYLKPSFDDADPGTKDDAYWAIGHRFEIRF